MYAVVGGMLALLLVMAAATITARLYVTALSSHILGSLRPAQAQIANLTEGYIDMETGERGFLLTGDSQLLSPYTAGQSEITRARAALGRDLADDPTATSLLTAVTAAGIAWQQQAAEPEIAGVHAGTLDGAAMTDSVVTSKQLFDTLRGRLTALQDRINQLTATAVQAANNIQTTATLISVICAALALLVGATTVVLVRRSLVGPITRLLTQVHRVSGGQLDLPVDATGPSEVEDLAVAVERMRQRIRTEIANAETVAGRMARLAEADRIAHDVGGRVSRELFATSLAAQSAAGHYPRARSAFTDITHSIDRALSELRLAMYGQPDVRPGDGANRGAPDAVATELLAVVWDTVAAAAGAETTDAPEVEVSVENGMVRLCITIDRSSGGQAELLDGIAERAARWDGNTNAPVADRPTE